jgi:lipopolysaccharide transport system ATP-binding protein
MNHAASERRIHLVENDPIEAQQREPIVSTALGRPSALAIEIANMWLQYPIGPVARGSLKSLMFGLFGHREDIPRPQYVDALKDINVRIVNGERVGLIGHNGSGKSTLLRALAGVYPVTRGKVEVHGRISTLLETGLGFELEATGRENIYYRGMAMGMSKRELRKAEADIIAFASLGDFIDLPMRTYSAGMYVRLGFAVSTNFSPDILLIDEVFGAGDIQFQKKAFARMLDIVSQAGIVVIATHDHSLVEQLCTRVIWLDRGKVVRDGLPANVLPEFHQHFVGT